jgi:hypothetical protein
LYNLQNEAKIFKFFNGSATPLLQISTSSGTIPRCLHVGDDGLDTRKGRVRENAEPGSTGYDMAEELQLFRR